MRSCWGSAGPISFALASLHPDAPRWGAGFKNACKEYFNRTMTLQSFCTSIPLESNSISLDPELKDAWGLPAMRVTYGEHPDTLKTRKFFADRSLEILEAA